MTRQPHFLHVFRAAAAVRMALPKGTCALAVVVIFAMICNASVFTSGDMFGHTSAPTSSANLGANDEASLLAVSSVVLPGRSRGRPELDVSFSEVAAFSTVGQAEVGASTARLPDAGEEQEFREELQSAPSVAVDLQTSQEIIPSASDFRMLAHPWVAHIGRSLAARSTLAAAVVSHLRTRSVEAEATSVTSGLIVIVVFFCIGCLVVLYMAISSNANPPKPPQRSSKTGPSRPRQSGRSRRQAPGAPPVPAAAAGGGGGRGSTATPTPRPSIPTVPQGHQYTMSLPSLLSAPMVPSSSTDYQVFDSSAQKLLHVNVFRPAAVFHEDDADAEVLEYVTLAGPDQEEELAVLALGRQVDAGRGLDCHVFQGSEELFGILKQSSLGDGYELTMADMWQSKVLQIKGQFDQRRLQIFGSKSEPIAMVEPKSSSEYQVTCMPDADVGLIVVSLLGIDRLRAHA